MVHRCSPGCLASTKYALHTSSRLPCHLHMRLLFSMSREVSGLSTPFRGGGGGGRLWRCRPQTHTELSCLHQEIRHILRAPISPRSLSRPGEDSNCSAASLVIVCRWALACLNSICPEATLSGNNSIPQAHLALAVGILHSLRLPSYESTLVPASLLNPISSTFRLALVILLTAEVFPPVEAEGHAESVATTGCLRKQRTGALP